MSAVRPEVRTALVTGAGQGIGRAIALALASKGIAVAVNDLDEKHAKAVCDEIIAGGGQALPLVGDVSSPETVASMAQDLFSQWSHLTVLVNNAGVVRTGTVLEVTPEEWDFVMAVNLRSMFLTARAVLPQMQAACYGKIVNMASVAGFVGGGLLGNSCYAASKAGVIAFTKGLAREGGAFGIRANAITPALTDTDMTSVIADDKRASLINQIPLGRAGKPGDIANAVVFLASEESDFITGETLVVDGGFMRR